MDSDVDIAPPHKSDGSGRTLPRRHGADETGGLRTAARVAIHALIAGARWRFSAVWPSS